MSRSSLHLVSLILLVLASCATAPPPGRPVLVVLAPYVSPSLPKEAAARLLVERLVEALRASGRYTLRTKGFFEGGYDTAMAAPSYPRTAVLGDEERDALAIALKITAVGLTDFVTDESGRNLRATFRVVDAGTGALLESYRFYIPAFDPAAWGSTVKNQLAKAQLPGPRTPNPRLDGRGTWEAGWALAPDVVEAPGWKESLERARLSGDFDEALRLIDLALDRLRSPDPEWLAVRDKLRKQLLTERRWNLEDGDVAELSAVLSASRGTVGEEQRFQVEFLARVRATMAHSEAFLRREVVDGFRDRFGLDLGVMLTRPALVVVEGGSFTQGSDTGEADEKPAHSVTVPGFLIAQTEITQDQYAAVTGFNPSLFLQTATAPWQPVERVTWFDAVEYCNRLSVKEGLDPVYTLAKRNPASGYPIKSAEVTQDRTKTGYRLPTEAEWEWAARGGALSRGTLLSGGADPALVAWTDGTTGGPGRVAARQPNELGLFDMSGNVWEWCWDWYGKYEAAPVGDPTGVPTGIARVGRGGSWHAAAWNARVTTRSFDSPGSRGNNIGFRVVRTLTPP